MAKPETIVPMGKWLPGKAASQHCSESTVVECPMPIVLAGVAQPSVLVPDLTSLISTQTLERDLSSEGSCALKLSLGGAAFLLCNYNSPQAF